MKKLFRIVVIGLSAAFLVFPAKAVVITPSTGTFNIGATTTFTISTEFPEGAPTTLDGVEVYMSVTGGTVTGFVASNNFTSPPPISECQGGTFYTSSLVCGGFALSSGYLTNGETLGTFTVQWSATGTATIVNTDNTSYIDSAHQQTYPDAGTVGTFTIVSADTTITPTATITPTGGRVPETGIADDGGAIVVGVVVILSGIVLYNYSKKKFIEKNEGE
jgi:hypothetical protein